MQYRPTHTNLQQAAGNKKTFVIPSNNDPVLITFISIHLSTTGNAGTRLLGIQFLDTDGSTVIYETKSAYDMSTNADQYLTAVPGGSFFADSNRQRCSVPLPNPCILTPGQTIQGLDEANIDNTDTLKMFVQWMNQF